jgi:hypothetical protein
MPLIYNGLSTGYGGVPVGQIISQASNVKAGGSNPAFSASDFLAFYPRFKNLDPSLTDGYTEGVNIPDAAFDDFLVMANAVILEVRWHSQWKMAMCLFIAHQAILYLSAMSGTTVPGLLASAVPRSLITAKAVGDVSVSYDTNSISDDLKGYGDLQSTIYGQQLATRARILGKAGMMVW